MKPILTGLILVVVIGSVKAGSPSTVPEQLLGHYYLIQKSLASDSIGGVSLAAAQMTAISRRAAATGPPTETQLSRLADAATKLPATDLRSARNGFGELTDSLIAYLQATPAQVNFPYQFFCSMVKKNWLQPDKEIRNPYCGSAMLKCGELVKPGQPVEPGMKPIHR